MANVTPDLIFQIANGFIAAKHLFVANEVGLFEKLAEGAGGGLRFAGFTNMRNFGGSPNCHRRFEQAAGLATRT